MKKWWISGLAVLALGAARSMATPSYTAVFLPSSGTADSYAEDIASDGQIVGYSTTGDALIWNGPYSLPADLGHSGFMSTQIFATDGTVQAGQGILPAGPQAVIWDGTAQSEVDLNPPGFYTSSINDVAVDQEVGLGFPTSTSPLHALLWNGDDPNAIDLNPPGYAQSNANGTNGTYQVGAGTPNPINGVPQGTRAIIWSGTAASAVDITPAGYTDAYASGISGDLVAGGGSPGTGQTDALMWNLTSGSYIDLGPGTVYASAGDYAVGYRNVGPNHAMLWDGSTDTSIDLNNYLPPGYASIAYGVNADGDVVGGASNGSDYYAVEWIAPEPSVLIMAISSLMLRFRRRQN